MPETISHALSDRVERVRRFFTETVWRPDVDELSRPRAFGYRSARLLVASARAFSQHKIQSRAAALTFYTVLAIVPLLAFAFSVVKGLGGYEQLVDGTIRPWVQETFAGNAQLVDAFETVFAFVAETNLASLGAVGLAVIIYTGVQLLGEIAQALNSLWAAAARRTLVRQVTDFVAMIVLAPLGLLLAVSVVATATAASSPVVSYLRDRLHLGIVFDLAMSALPLVAALVGFALMYALLPNTRTRARSVLLGALIGALLWYGALVLHVQFQLGVAKYSALYAGFAALPIFLFWVYVSWTTVLIGAIVAATHQNWRQVEQQRFLYADDQVLREAVALDALARIARSFLQPEATPRAWTLGALATELEVPEHVLDDVLERLTVAGVLVRTGEGTTATFLPGRDPSGVRVADVLMELRHVWIPGRDREASPHGRSRVVEETIRALEDELVRSPCNRSMAALATLLESPPRREEA